MRITVVTPEGRVVAEIKNCKTIKGAKSKIRESSVAMRKGWIIRIEETIE
jgi:hypothetical protein